MVDYTGPFERLTAEHVLLVTMLGLSVLFYVEPIVQDYPNDARVFPQMMAVVVGVGSALLLAQNYLPGPIRRFVAESVSIAADEEEMEDFVDEETDETEDETEETEEESAGKEPPLHVAWGYDLNNTIIMIVFSTVYFTLGWAAGFLYVTPLFVFGYTYWFRVKWYKGVFLAVLATVIVFGFIEFLLMPFDEGELIFTRGLL
ncbi:MAG: tripartite tricarboxylate transporter TctB family protein [Natronomonas sp.]